MYSSDVSLKPPLRALHSGVRAARVMTMSSGFLESLRVCRQRPVRGNRGGASGREGKGGGAYTSSSPELGLMCLRMDPTRSVAMVSVLVLEPGISFQKAKTYGRENGR